MRHDRPIENGAGSCELTEEPSTGGRNIKETDKKASYGHSALLHLQIVQMHMQFREQLSMAGKMENILP